MSLAVSKLPKVETDPDSPSPGVTALAGAACGLTLYRVMPHAPLWWRDCAALMARQLQRDMLSDVELFDAASTADLYEAWLFVKPFRDGRVVCGACCFRWRTWNDMPDGWSMQWAWLHPDFRREGCMSAAWTVFLRRYAPFMVERPISKAMHGFLAKRLGEGFEVKGEPVIVERSKT